MAKTSTNLAKNSIKRKNNIKNRRKNSIKNRIQISNTTLEFE